jgi:hypothetical protein
MLKRFLGKPAYPHTVGSSAKLSLAEYCGVISVEKASPAASVNLVFELSTTITRTLYSFT